MSTDHVITQSTYELDPFGNRSKEGFQSYFRRFILWENNKIFKQERGHLKDWIEWMEDNEDAELAQLLRSARNYDRLEIAPIYACNFIRDEEWRFEILYDLIKSPINLYNMRRMLNPVFSTTLIAKKFLEKLKNVSSSWGTIPFISKKDIESLCSSDHNDSAKAIRKISQHLENMAERYYQDYNNSMSPYADNKFEKLTEDQVLDKLANSTLLEFLNMMNDAIFFGIDKSILNLELRKKCSAQSGIIPMKFFQTMWANYKRIISSDYNYNEYLWASKQIERYQEIKKSKYFIIDILSDVLNDMFLKLRPLPGLTVMAQDISGSMKSNISPDFNIWAREIGLMMIYQIVKMSDKAAVILTGEKDTNYNERDLHGSVFMDLTNFNSWDCIEFIIHAYKTYKDKEISEGGIFTHQLVSWIKEHETNGQKISIWNNKDRKPETILLKEGSIKTLMIYSDSADVDNDVNIRTEFDRTRIDVAQKAYIINVDNSTDPCIRRTPMWDANIMNYSDYLPEFIWSTQGVACPSDKGSDVNGNPARGIL